MGSLERKLRRQAKSKMNHQKVNATDADEAIQMMVDEAFARGLKQGSKATATAFMYALNVEHGWGKTRLNRLFDVVVTLINNSADGELTLDDMQKLVEQKCEKKC